MAELSKAAFKNFDDEAVYAESQKRARNQYARNFVVQFGKEGAEVAFDLTTENFKALWEEQVAPERPVRWINIWAPDQQVEIVNLLGERYDFSRRLLAIMGTHPPQVEQAQEEKANLFRQRRSLAKKEVDVELAESTETSTDDVKGRNRTGALQSEISHYTLAEQMINYQSTDSGAKYLCIGANWMHRRAEVSEDINISAEGEQRRLWSWLVLGYDHTVISLHEDPGEIENPQDVKSIRANTLSVLSQLSVLGHLSADPISMQTVRQALKHDVDELSQGVEGASLLFYYLFEDWRAVVLTVDMFKKRLGALRKTILGDITRKSITDTPRIEIIPRLHVLGGQIRQSQHLYEGYKNLIERALRALEPGPALGLSTPRTFSNLGLVPVQDGLVLAKSARQRFERLSDRIELLILSKTKEFLDEKEALISTYFNINAQKDSEATARLTRSATLLAKLSVLFLPVSLMTSYFSVQISDLQGVYTSKDYWYAFAILMSISFLFVFFFSRLLMWVSESLDARVKRTYIVTTKYLAKKFNREARKQ